MRPVTSSEFMGRGADCYLYAQRIADASVMSASYASEGR